MGGSESLERPLVQATPADVALHEVVALARADERGTWDALMDRHH